MAGQIRLNERKKQQNDDDAQQKHRHFIAREHTPVSYTHLGRRAVSASTIKVFILLAALDEVRRGRLALDTPVAVTAEDILPDTGVFVRCV